MIYLTARAGAGPDRIHNPAMNCPRKAVGHAWRMTLGCSGGQMPQKAPNMIRVTLLIQIPWRSLGQSPVIVEIDSIFLLACPKTEADVIADEAAAVILPSHPVPSQDAFCGGCTFVTQMNMYTHGCPSSSAGF